VPRPVIAEARRYLQELERREHTARPPSPQQELSLHPPVNETESALRRMLEGVDPESLSPRAALDVLFRLKELLEHPDA
jgi:DNA mismatch repair protein MutS